MNTPKIARMNDERIDRLSDLPNHVIYHILSFMDTKYAVHTCVLSKKWKYHWTNIHSLNFDYQSFSRWILFKNFVPRILKELQTSSNTRTLRFHCGVTMCPALADEVLWYAKLRNVEEIDIDLNIHPPILTFCKTLKTLKLGPCTFKNSMPELDFASLTTLQLTRVWISFLTEDYDIFSNCSNLKNLTLTGCRVANTRNFKIYGKRLVNLTISNLKCYASINVWHRTIVIDAPRLRFFDFNGDYPLGLSMKRCRALEKVNTHMFSSRFKEESFYHLIKMAEELHNAESITLSLKCSYKVSK